MKEGRVLAKGSSKEVFNEVQLQKAYVWLIRLVMMDDGTWLFNSIN